MFVSVSFVKLLNWLETSIFVRIVANRRNEGELAVRCDLIKIMFLYSRHAMQSVTFLLKMSVNEILR